MSDEPSASKPKLPRGWEKVSLAQVVQINPALDRCVVADAVAVNFVPMRAVEPGGGGLLRPEVRSYGEVKKGYTAFLSGDVIMAKITPCMENGKTTVVPELPGSVCFGSTEFHVLRRENGVEARWITNFLLQHDVRRSAQRAMGGGDRAGAGEAGAIPGGGAEGRGGRRVDRRLAEEASQGRASLGPAHPHPRRTPPPLGGRPAPQVQGSRQGPAQELEGEIQGTRCAGHDQFAGPTEEVVLGDRRPTCLGVRLRNVGEVSCNKWGFSCSAYSQHHRREA